MQKTLRIMQSFYSEREIDLLRNYFRKRYYDFSSVRRRRIGLWRKNNETQGSEYGVFIDEC